MRVAYLISLYPAVSHTFIRREIDELRRRGIAIHTFSVNIPRLSDLISDYDRAAFAETTYIADRSWLAVAKAHFHACASRPLHYFQSLRAALGQRAPGMKALLKCIMYFGGAMILALELRRHRIEHLHNHFANSAAIVGLLAAGYLRIPWSFTLHGISETDYPAGLLLDGKIQTAQFVACASYFGRAQAMRTTRSEHWDKLFICRCGVRLSNLPKRQTPVEGLHTRYICVARLSHEKAHAGLLVAFAEVKRRGINATLVLVGDGPERANIERDVSNYQLKNDVTFLGNLGENETLAEISSSDVLVLASLMEGLPLVLIEAMALGLPVVASHVAGIPELIENGVNGFLFKPTDWDGLAGLMALLAHDAELRKRLGAAGRKRIQSEFAIEIATQPMYERFGGNARYCLKGGVCGDRIV
jgi:colanic acid/amylovoran biosynthesis glycosyltransferase